MSFRSPTSFHTRLVYHPSLSRCYSTKSPLPEVIRSHVHPHLVSLRTNLTVRTRQAVSSLAHHAAIAGLKLNEVTGYEQVERLKAQVAAQELVLERARKAAREAKVAYDLAVAKRSSAQRDVNSLLERKHSWTDSDVSAFTTLVRADHSSTNEVASTSSSLKEQEFAVDKAFTDLTSAILQRYHEEQVWSDKIRSVSTWANVIGLAFNFLIFVIAIAIVEPWKRRRLVERVEERMSGMMERVEAQIESLRTPQEKSSPAAVEEVVVPPPLPVATANTPAVISPTSLVSRLAQRYLEVEVPLTDTQSHLACAGLGALIGGVTLSMLSTLWR